ncbi:hypothetical protein P3H15_33980 [Rhodococcus sp. T2V]|nr:hypothetical protein [Rhodococcus sp. T2V]
MGSVNLPGYIVAGLASVAIIIGSIAPWVSSWFISVPGTQSVGKFTLALGGIAAVALLIKAATPRRWPLVVAVVMGILCLVIAVVALVKASSLIPADDLRDGTVSVGWGLWMTLVGAVLLVVGSLVAEMVASPLAFSETDSTGSGFAARNAPVPDDPADWADTASSALLIVAVIFGGLVAGVVMLDLLFGVTLLP